MEERVTRAGRTADAFTLVALAVAEGSAEALRAARKIRGDNQPQQALAEAGQMLMKWRHYGLAADLLTETGRYPGGGTMR
jgi:hypothetical protein